MKQKYKVKMGKNGIGQKFKNTFDIFGEGVSLTINDNATLTTYTGAFLSVMIFTVVIIFAQKKTQF